MRHAEANLSPRNFELEISKKGIQCLILKLKILGQWEECPKGQKIFGLCPAGIKKNPKTLDPRMFMEHDSVPRIRFILGYIVLFFNIVYAHC